MRGFQSGLQLAFCKPELFGADRLGGAYATSSLTWSHATIYLYPATGYVSMALQTVAVRPQTG